MMQFDPNDEWDVDYVKKIGAEPWMLDALAINPSYCGWHPGDDYMLGSARPGEHGGFGHAIKIKSWGEFTFPLDEMNVFADFHFNVHADETCCTACNSSGYSEVARAVIGSLVGVLLRTLSPEEQAAVRKVSLAADSEAISSSGRDAVARMRLGAAIHCADCEGSGVSSFNNTRLQLELWVLHPRKGASRGVIIDRIEKHEVKEACDFLRKAAEANAQRFTRAIAYSYAGSLCEHEDCASHDDMLIACGKSRAQIEAP